MRLRIELLITPLLMITGFTISAFAAFWLYEMEKKSLVTSFQKEVDLRAASLHSELTVNFEALHEMGIFFGNDHVPEHDEFSELAQEIMKHLPGIHTLQWIPRVTSENREELLKTIKNHYPDFEITQAQEQGEMIPASPKNEHFPIYFIEPYLGNETSLGYDISTCDIRSSALEAARDSGLPQATASVTLDQGQMRQKGFIAIMPVYNGPHETTEDRRKSLAGFVLGVYKIDDLFKRSEVTGQVDNIHMLLIDKTDPDVEVLTENFYEIEHEDDEHHEQPMFYEKDLPSMFGRQWAITSHPTHHYISNNITPLPYVVFLFGALFKKD